jgi:hypothetical protein
MLVLDFLDSNLQKNYDCCSQVMQFMAFLSQQYKWTKTISLLEMTITQKVLWLNTSHCRALPLVGVCFFPPPGQNATCGLAGPEALVTGYPY